MENKRLYGLVCFLHRQMSRDNHKLFLQYGITYVQVHAMVFIQCETGAGRNVCQKDIEKHINLRASATSTMLANLEKTGFIVRTVSEGDARTKYVNLTEKGKKVCLQNKKFMDESDNLIQAALTEDEQETFKNLLLKIIAENEKHGKEECND